MGIRIKSYNIFLNRFLASTLDEDYSVDHLHKVSMMWSAIPQSFHTSTVPFDFMIANWSTIRARYDDRYYYEMIPQTNPNLICRFAEYKTIMKTIVEAATFNLQKETELDSVIPIHRLD